MDKPSAMFAGFWYRLSQVVPKKELVKRLLVVLITS